MTEKLTNNNADKVFLAYWESTHDFNFHEGSGMYEIHAKTFFVAGFNAALSTPANDLRPAVYVASKTKHAHEWKTKRSNGYPIISTWIDESGVGETLDWPDLWSRCIAEASNCSALVLVCREGDVLKGAWAEAGAALASGNPVYAVGCDSFSIRHHPLFFSCTSEDEAFTSAALAQKGDA